MRRATPHYSRFLLGLVLLLSVLLASAASKPATTHQAGGHGGMDKVVVPGHPPLAYRAKVVAVPPGRTAGVNIIAGVPAFLWSYGCSATSAAMLVGFYDNNGLPNMYTGPANDGACPLTNDVWGVTGSLLPGTAECPLSASHQGVDGRTTRGHVDDYWVAYGSADPDPYITGKWAQHSPQDCLGDFMGTNQSYYGNVDGSTTFLFNGDGSPTEDPNDGLATDLDGCHGMRLFAVSRGYTVADNYNQYIQGYNGMTQGFTFAQYMAEIDAGHPVLIQVVGHTMIGYGYNTTGNLIYLHDTWDEQQHTMPWGGAYFDGTTNLQHFAVTVLDMTPVSTPAPYHPADTNKDGRISINELTAYGKAWKLGRSWPVAPSPIPLDFVTQAGVIWHGGESYQYNATLPAPQCWVAGQMAATSAAQVLSPLAPASAVSAITPQRTAGSTRYLVTLSITPPAGCANFAVAETIPTGWTVVNCETPGVVNALAGTLHWGPFFAAQPIRLCYTLAPRGATPRAGTLAGTLSVDGTSVPITGMRKLP